MRIGKERRVVKSPVRRTQKADKKKPEPIPVYIPQKEPVKVEAFKVTAWARYIGVDYSADAFKIIHTEGA